MTDQTQPQENLRIWKELFPTDPRYTKPFVRAGGFRGTSIDPMWRVMRLTEHFGPEGIGWGYEEPRFLTIDAGDETAVNCVLKCWYRETPESEPAYIWGIGGNMLKSTRTGGSYVNDEAYKMALTDALTNAFLRLGLGADVSLNLHQDSKYLAAVRESYDNSRAILNQNQITQQPQPQKEKTPTAPPFNGPYKPVTP